MSFQARLTRRCLGGRDLAVGKFRQQERHSMTSKSFTFSHAICRKPSRSIVDGLRAVDTGAPDLGVFESHHADYVAALRETGANVTVLDALDDFPDRNRFSACRPFRRRRALRGQPAFTAGGEVIMA